MTKRNVMHKIINRSYRIIVHSLILVYVCIPDANQHSKITCAHTTRGEIKETRKGKEKKYT